MAALVVNRPGAGLDSGRQGSRGTAVVKVRDLAYSVLRHLPPVHAGDLAALQRPWLLGAGMRGPLGPSRLYKLCPPFLRPEVAWSPGHASLLLGVANGDIREKEPIDMLE